MPPPQTTASATDIATTPPAARPGAIISAEALRARYASLTAFRATVEQEKTARFLARPLKSEVEIEMKDGRIDWRSTRPVKSAIAIDQNGIHMESGAAPGQLKWLSNSSLVQFSSVAQSCPTVCDPMNRSTPGLPVHHHLPEFTQIHVHRVSDAIQPSHPLSSPSPPAPNPSQHQSLFQ